jgi:hypothetical protein
MADQIRFHLDEHVDPDIARALRQHGIDVTTTSEMNLLAQICISVFSTQPLPEPLAFFTGSYARPRKYATIKSRAMSCHSLEAENKDMITTPIRVYADTSVFGGVFDAEFKGACQLFFEQVER